MPTDVTLDDDAARLADLGYRPQLNRVLGLFANFSVAFTYLSPMVGVLTLFAYGAGIAGPAFVWLTWIPLAGMLLVALVFGELASHYPVAGSLYQYSKYSVGRTYGWFVGWFYGVALLVTVASVDTGVVSYVVALGRIWFGWHFDPSNHSVILLVTLVLLAIQTTLNMVGARVMGRVAQFGVLVGIAGTFGIAIILAIHGFHHGVGYLASTQGVQRGAASNPLGVNFGGNWLSAALIAVLVPAYILIGFESAGDISEETKNAGRRVPRAMRLALIWGGIASFVLMGALLLAMPQGTGGFAGTIGYGVPYILAQLPIWLQDLIVVLIIFAFITCGSSVQGVGSRLAFSYARDGMLPASKWISTVSERFKTPVNALFGGALVTVVFIGLGFVLPTHDVKILFFTYPANVSVLRALVSLGVSGIYLSFLLTVIGYLIARSRGWTPAGVFRLGRWAWPVAIAAAVYLGVMLVNIVAPTGLSSPRGRFNIDWVTLVVMAVVAVVGLILFLVARQGREAEDAAAEDILAEDAPAGDGEPAPAPRA